MIAFTVIKPAKLASADEAPGLEKTFLFEQIYLGRTICLQFLQVTKAPPTKPVFTVFLMLAKQGKEEYLLVFVPRCKTFVPTQGNSL